jgi:predicted metal-dependent HD superfamily phosphohydrolase
VSAFGRPEIRSFEAKPGGATLHLPMRGMDRLRVRRGRAIVGPSTPALCCAMTTDDMAQTYSAPGRHYHNLRHIEDCLAALDGVAGLSARDREVLTAAIWWHDIVYDPTRSDNEEESAKRAEQDLAPDLRHDVGRLIRLTRTHDVQPGDRLGAILISIDLAILGAAPSAYVAYAAAIRREYAHVGDDAYRAGRLAVLERFAARPAIYPDPSFAMRLEKQARANIAREIETLRSSAPKG